MKLTPDNEARLGAWKEAGSGVRDALFGRGDVTWKQARDAYVDRMEALLPPPAGVDFQDMTLDGVPTILATPQHPEQDRVLLYLHGGGYVHSAARAYRGLTGHYAERLGARVYVPDYRQAPEDPFPAPIDDVVRAYRALLAMGHDPARIAVSGDSAGGAMVVTLMRKARDAGVPLPVAGAAFSPWADLTHSGLSARTRNGLDPLGTVESLDLLARTFLGDALATDPDASPIYADLRGLAPTLIQVGENEIMLSGAIRLAERLAEQRVRTTIEVWPGMFHVFQRLVGHMAEADEALDNAVAFLAREYDRSRRHSGDGRR